MRDVIVVGQLRIATIWSYTQNFAHTESWNVVIDDVTN